MDLSGLADLDYCYLTTIGRVSGEKREIEIWFALHGETLYLMAGGRDRANWVRNIRKTPRVSVRIGDETVAADGRIIAPGTGEDALARRLLFAKYEPRSGNLASWRDAALPVALDVVPRAQDL
jgi:deazaflavin-dependent oxidoreductase (nitroreductase family)